MQLNNLSLSCRLPFAYLNSIIKQFAAAITYLSDGLPSSPVSCSSCSMCGLRAAMGQICFVVFRFGTFLIRQIQADFPPSISRLNSASRECICARFASCQPFAALPQFCILMPELWQFASYFEAYAVTSAHMALIICHPQYVCCRLSIVSKVNCNFVQDRTNYHIRI